MLVSAAFFVAGIIKGMVGLGMPIVVLVFLAVPLGITNAIALMLVPSVITNFWQAVFGPSLMPLLRRLWTFLLFSVLGICLGVSLLSYVTQEVMLAFLGGLLALYSIFSLRNPQIRPPGRYEAVMSPAAGGLGGILFGMVGIFLVPGVIYLQALGLKKDELVQALGITFITLSITLFGAFVEKGVMNTELFLWSWAALVPAVLGLYLGQRLRSRVSETLFRTIFFWVLLFVGFHFIWSGWG